MSLETMILSAVRQSRLDKKAGGRREEQAPSVQWGGDCRWGQGGKGVPGVGAGRPTLEEGVARDRGHLRSCPVLWTSWGEGEKGLSEVVGGGGFQADARKE